MPVILSAVLVHATATSSPVAAAAGETITGIAFRDINSNGVRDGLETAQSGILVRAVDPLGNGSPTVTTAANGTYTLNLNGLGPAAGATYRVEFVIPPAFTYLKPAQVPVAATVGVVRNGGDVQFVAANATNVAFGVENPGDYCGANPKIVTTCFSGIGSATNRTSLETIPYLSGTTSTVSNANLMTPAPTSLQLRNTTGAVGGLGYHRGSQNVLAAAFAKRHTGYPGGPDPTGPDKIYVSGTGVSPTFTTFFTADAGNDLHNYADPINDNGFWDPVGKTAWGNISVSEDDSTLYAINQFDKKLYIIPIVQVGSTITAGAAITVTFANAATDCGLAGPSINDWVPGAVTQKDGVVYLGITCTAQTSQLKTDMRAIVYRYTGGATATTQVSNFLLNYPRGAASTDGTNIAPAAWQPWVPTQTLSVPGAPGTGRPYGQASYPQPWVTGITFDEANNMVVGMTDRAEHQFGNINGTNTGNVEGVSAGDTVKLTPSGPNWVYTAGNDDFYNTERFPLVAPAHEELSLGFVLHLPGSNDVVTNVYDPAPVGGSVTPPTGPPFANAFRSGGLIWMSNTDGSRTRSYQVFGQDEPGTFGKVGGIGDVELICEMAPIQIGNRIWNDANANGIQDANEAGIPAVTVRLMQGLVVIGTAVTAADGSYYFGGSENRNLNVGVSLLPNTAYSIRVDNPANYTGAGPLTNKSPSPALVGTNRAIDSNATLPNPTAPIGTGNFPSVAYTTGPPGANDLTLDAGFMPAGTIGTTIWHDQNWNNLYDPGEGLANINVTLTWAGPDGIFGTPDDVVSTQLTDAVGRYLFTNLPPGNYRVAVTITGNAISQLQLANSVDPDGGLNSQSALTLPVGGSNLLQNFAYRRVANDKMYYFSLGGATGPGPGAGQYTQMVLTSPIALTSQQLVLSLRNGYVPVVGDTMDIVMAPSMTGSYRAIYGNIMTNGVVLDVQYLPDRVRLVAVKGLIVNSFNDTVDAVPGDGTCADVSGRCTLRAAVMEANAEAGRQSIVLAGGGVYQLTIPGAGEDLSATGDLDVNDALTIYGPSATIDANGLGDRALHLRNNSTDHLVGLTVQGGNSAGGAGGVFVEVATATLDDVTITNNSGPYAGGLGVFTSTVTYNRGVITNNTSSNAGGGVAVGTSGGPSYLLLDRATVVNNNGTLYGGGLLSIGNGAVLEVRDATVTNNSAQIGGGGAAVLLGEIRLTRGVIRANTASVKGGGLAVDGRLTVNEGLISGNSAPLGGGIAIIGGAVASVDKVTISNNTATVAGGGIRVEGGTTSAMTTSTVSTNSAPVGAAIDWASGAPISLNSVTLTANNTSAGAALNSAGAGGISLTNSIIADQAAGTQCGGVAGGVASGGYNLTNTGSLASCGLVGVGDAQALSALLGALAYNGGIGFTHKPQALSPAVNTGGLCPVSDQRGFPRPRGGACEKGSIEL